MKRVRICGDHDVDRPFIRKDCHEACRLYDSLCDCNLSRSSEKSADKSGFGKHCEGRLLLLLFG